jgi:3',5'-cyclic AMP phosphodiesterase CpdA
MRIAHVSDIHVGAHDDLALDGLGADLHAAGVAATIVTGDLTMRARTHEFARAREVIAGFPQPAMIVIGNHDVPLTNPLARMSTPYEKFRTHVTDEMDPYLDLSAVRVQGLGSMPRWRWKSGRVSDQQADVVRAAFADAPTGVARVVALHHPLSSDGLESLAGGGELERALVEAEVDVVLAGHTHVPAVQVLEVGGPGRTRPVIEVVAGTATSHRTRGVARSWSLLEFHAATLTVTEHHADGHQWIPGPPVTLALAPGTHRPAP